MHWIKKLIALVSLIDRKIQAYYDVSINARPHVLKVVIHLVSGGLLFF